MPPCPLFSCFFLGEGFTILGNQIRFSSDSRHGPQTPLASRLARSKCCSKSSTDFSWLPRLLYKIPRFKPRLTTWGHFGLQSEAQSSPPTKKPMKRETRGFGFAQRSFHVGFPKWPRFLGDLDPQDHISALSVLNESPNGPASIDTRKLDRSELSVRGSAIYKKLQKRQKPARKSPCGLMR